MNGEEWLKELFKNCPQLDNTLGYQCLHRVLLDSERNLDDITLINKAINLYNEEMALKYEDAPES